jgi:hypothetical protein
MKLMRRVALLLALAGCLGCADSMSSNPPSTNPDSTPVGTTGRTEPQQPAQTQPRQPAQVESTRRGLIPVGQELDVRLQTPLSSGTATPEQRFEATTAVDLMQGDTELIPAGSTVRGVVSSVEKAGRVDRSGRLTLAFDQITINGRDYPIRAMAAEVFESRGIRDEAKTVGTAGAVGAIVGGIIGGVKGALIGAAVGSGGVIAATEGKDVELAPGTMIRIRMDQQLQLR